MLKSAASPDREPVAVARQVYRAADYGLHYAAWRPSRAITGGCPSGRHLARCAALASTDIRDDLLKSTPLGWACRWGRVDLVKLLLERGADPVEADAEAWATPRAWAEKMKHDKVLAVLNGDIALPIGDIV